MKIAPNPGATPPGGPRLEYDHHRPLPTAGEAEFVPTLADVAKQRVRSLGVLAWPLLALIALLLYDYFFVPNFFQISVNEQTGGLYGSVIDVARNGTIVLLLALGMSLVIATGGIDLSVGTVMAIAGAVTVSMLAPPVGSPFGLSSPDKEGHQFPMLLHFLATKHVWFAIAMGLLAALVCGLWNGVLVAFFKLQPIIATLILMVAGRGIAQLITNGAIPNYDQVTFTRLFNGFVWTVPIPVYIGVFAAIVMLLLVRGTAIGLFVEAVGNNRVASRIAGVDATGTRFACYVITGLLAGVGGVIGAANIGSADVNNLGQFLELDAILAVAIGGTSLVGGRFSLLGAILGAVVIQLLTTTIYAKGAPQETTFLIKAGVVIALCLLQSPKFRGLFRIRRRAA